MKNSANINGLKFENSINSFNRLLSFDFIKNPLIKKHYLNCHYILEKKYGNKHILFTLQSGFKKYIKNVYNIDLIRNPDEVFIIKYENKIKIVIIEKKYQIVAGSCDIKIWSSPALKDEYKILFNKINNLDIQIEYVLCVNNYFKNKFNSDNLKFNILLEILNNNNIHVLYGEDKNYFKNLDKIVFSNF